MWHIAHDMTMSNCNSKLLIAERLYLEPRVEQTDKQTDRQTDRQTVHIIIIEQEKQHKQTTLNVLIAYYPSARAYVRACVCACVCARVYVFFGLSIYLMRGK